MGFFSNKFLLVICFFLLSLISLKGGVESRAQISNLNSTSTLPSTMPPTTPTTPKEDGGTEDYDDKDVQFDTSPPNLLILLADSKNGSTVPLANQPNTEVVLDKKYEKVHLFCSAYYPIRWVYHGDGFPFLNVDYTRFVEDFYDPTSYAFSALLELDGLQESQSGNYSCQKWDDPKFSSSFHAYIPGGRMFLIEDNLNLTMSSGNTMEFRIPCSLSDPSVNVSLLKSKDGNNWIPLSPSLYSFSPKSGFTVKLSSSNLSSWKTQSLSSQGLSESYRCSADNGKEITVNLKVENSKEESLKNDCCDKKYLRGLGDERTSCRGFISQSCQAPEYFNSLTSDCSDWKISEFLQSSVELCRQEIAPSSNSTVGAGYFTTSDEAEKPRLFMYCQADPEEFTQGFKMALEWTNGSTLFVDDERHLVPGLSDFPSGYEVHAEITDLLNPLAPTDPLTLHCYIPLKYSFKWIKISRVIPSSDLITFASTWYNDNQEKNNNKTTTTISTRISTRISTSKRPSGDEAFANGFNPTKRLPNIITKNDLESEEDETMEELAPLSSSASRKESIIFIAPFIITSLLIVVQEFYRLAALSG